jgi:prolipoprotein diacylglyceryltransferase
MNGIERFFIEKIRVNTEYNILGGITQAEIISFCLIITGLILSYLLSKKVIK